ncbi:phage tail protein [Mesorhizobium sp. CA4]|uniref:phage tail protein n=1 Tax=Mesorhizobium sp. CA4 TaxID=588499 RepID=UPI001CD10C2B|nr:phage tail protein [Mesorhizobium sp. CA4]MBZ9822344.1 phage tail protein [Mesorhizobium sp. CA4]
MSERQNLLPQNATAFERALSESLDRLPELQPGFDALRGFKAAPVQPSILPWLVVEYGLGGITQYLPDLASVIEYGLRWQRVKGTPQGVAESLTWVGYAFSTFHEAPLRRTRWHLYELELDRFRDSEGDLATIEAVVRLSDPVRSEFYRAWNGYNVREHDWSWSRWGDGIWGDTSGVFLHAGGVKWSFGRTFDAGFHELTEAELTALGAWVEPVEGGSISWGPFPWNTPGLQWVSDAAASRAQIIATALLARSCWIGVYRQDGSPIGFRKARVYRPVRALFGGYYQAAGQGWIVADAPGSNIYVEALMDFGEGEGETVHSWSVTLGGAPVGAHPAGIVWLPGAGVAGGAIVGGFDLAPALLGKTSRERFRAILKIV